MRHALALGVTLVALCGTVPGQGVMTTFAGTDWVFNGDGKPALSVHFNQPSAITVDPNGNPVVVDSYFGIVARLNPDGTLTVLAGNGFHGGDSGENGPATSAVLNNPVAAAFDHQGNLYIGESNSVRRVSPGGVITTIAGYLNYAGFSGDNGPAIKAHVYPSGIAVDLAGNIYIAEENNERLRKIDTNGIITTVAGNGQFGFSGDGGPATAASLGGPKGVAVDNGGNLYIADTYNNRVRRVTPVGIITTLIPDTGSGFYPYSLALDNSGVLYIGAYRAVYKLPPGTTTPQLIAGDGNTQGFSGDNGPAVQAVLNDVIAVAPDDKGNLFIADWFNYRVRKIDAKGMITTVAGVTPFPADRVPALDVPLSASGLTFDGAGNLFVAEATNNRVLKISPAGTITTFAGTGAFGYSGDNGPAAQATLRRPAGLAFYDGSLYLADTDNGIRRVKPDGIITTHASVPGGASALAFDKAGNLYVSCHYRSVCRIDTSGNLTVVAGNGDYGSSGDGGPAINATLASVASLAVDGDGNLYIADSSAFRVRVVTRRDGNINTYAGTGFSGPAGGGGLATQTFVPSPEGLALDASGNLYIASSLAHLALVVRPSGIITTLAGGGLDADQLGDGKPASQATLTSPGALAFDTAGNLYISDSGSNRIREVLASRPAMQVAPTSLSFSAPSGGAPVTQTVAVTGSIAGLQFNVTVNAAGNWLTADASSDSTPRLLTLTADPGSLPPGSYSAVVAITPVVATPGFTVGVTFQVGAGQPPSLRIDKPEISFTLPEMGPASSSTLLISNGGGQQLNYTATAGTSSGGPWLSISPASESASPGKPSTLTVTANPMDLSPGAYTGQVSIQSAAGKQTIPVVLTVSDEPQAVLLTQTGLSFTAVAQGGVIPPQTFGVVNAGIGAMNWTAGTSTTSGGNWLLISPAIGSSDAAPAAAPKITVSVKADGLAAGAYYGTVSVAAPGTANESRVVTVFLRVLPAGTPYAASVQPPELVFYANPSGGPPSSQVVNVYNIAATARSFSSGRSSGGSLLYTLPENGTLDPNQPTQVVVQPFYDKFQEAGFVAGTYTGALTFQFSDGSVQSVKVTVISAAPAAHSLSTRGADARRDAGAGSCAPTQLVVKLNTLSQAFQVSAGWPVGLSVGVTDDCQNPLVAGAGSVWAHFDDGEDDVVLASLGEGTWHGTWKPLKVNPNVTITLNARSGALITQRAIAGALSSANDQPVFTLSSIGTVFPSPGAIIRPLAPGSFLSIYGDRLADFRADAPGGALPAQLGNAQVFFDRQPAALSHADSGQINVVVPYGVNLNTSSQIRVQRGLTLSDPVAVDMAGAQPSVLQTNGNAYVLDSPADGSPAFLVTASAPANAGDILLLYCVGLGAADQQIKDGTMSPFSPPASVPGVTLNIGGQNAAIQFAGLTPGSVGLYQINAVMPAGVMPGAAVPLTVTANGQTSPAVTLATR